MKQPVVTAIGWLLVACTSAGIFAPAADAMVGDYLSYFNIPRVDLTGDIIPSRTIANELLAYINGATPGSEIRGHITTISDPTIRKALIDAHKRGVAVFLVQDGSSLKNPREYPSPQGDALEAYLGTRHKYCYEDRGWPGPSKSDISSCVSSLDGATHHIKNWMFSNTVVGNTRRTYSSWVTSYNLTNTSDRQYNDLFIVNDNYELYSAFVESFKSFYGQRRTDDFYNVFGRGHHIIPSANVEISYAPHVTPPGTKEYGWGNDHVALALARIGYEQGCALKVAMLSISHSRSALIEQLLRIRSIGCQVQIAYSAMSLRAYEDLTSGQVELRCKRWPDLERSEAIHSKMMLYKGNYDLHPGRTLVWGGSHNWTMGSARQRDEVFVAISRLGIYKNYSNYFDVIWTKWTRPAHQCVG